MKRHLIVLHVVSLSLLLIAVSSVQVSASDRTVNSILIGAGSGAIIGQALGRDTESTLLGTALGGAIGYAIGYESGRSHKHRPVYRRHETDHRSSYNPRSRHIRTERHYRDKRNFRNRGKICEKTVTIKERHGKIKRKVVKTCWYGAPVKARKFRKAIRRTERYY